LPNLSFDSVIQKLKLSKANISCDEFVSFLKKLGYKVRKGTNGKHHSYSHPDLDWFGSNFDCGHGRNPQVLPINIGKVIKILERHREEFSTT
jgi:hypothetical protein